MCLPVALSPAAGPPRIVQYLHDQETGILAARIHVAGDADTRGAAAVASVSVQIEGRDGSWLTLDLNSGRIEGIAVAVWPRVKQLCGLQPPPHSDHMDEVISGGAGGLGGVMNELTARVVAEVDELGRTVHFSLHRGARVAERAPCSTLRTVRIASDVMLEVDSARHIAGLWLLNVPKHSVPGS